MAEEHYLEIIMNHLCWPHLLYVLYLPDTKAHYFCQNHRPRYKTVLEMTLSNIQESQDT